MGECAVRLIQNIKLQKAIFFNKRRNGNVNVNESSRKIEDAVGVNKGHIYG